ncbi:MAG: Ig-like domain-containing protein [Candidatus Berkelbacteria bacterium]|nr:Ig-like domain-containing protein [Candidatus Berkelbacteria bacterium]
MKLKIPKFWEKIPSIKSWQFWLKIFLVVVIILAGIVGVLLFKRYQAVAPVSENKIAEIAPVIPTENAKKAVIAAPPKIKTSGKTSVKTNSDGSKTVTTATGPTNSADIAAAAAAGPSASISGIHYIDQTGKHSELGDQLKSYMSSNLLVKGEVTSMYSIILENAGDTGWAGLYSGSYNQDQSGHITSAWGYITLNSYYYEGNAYFTDYMKLILSHEYGHHYTLYYKWMVWQIPAGQRFPDSYYAIRPLTKSGTAPDYSLGWGNCDAEIMAEDYSYLYSGYGYHGMAATYGYPSAATRTWLVNEPGGSSAPAPASDSAPTVSITAPASGATVSGTMLFTATAADDNGVTKVGFYIDNNLLVDDSIAPYETTFNSASYGNGAHTLRARAYDTAGQTTDSTISITINNAVSDSENPTVTITDPADNPHAWSSGTLHISVSATDNVAVQKIEIYINDQLALTQNSSSISATWNYNNAPAGTYTLKAKAYDTSGNTAETSIVVNKT